ncbi:MAG: TonB-dependent receptor [Winogradskyella sp.]|uniref:TonB-dependent receptor n=1 Tax=Winogradskyella sp. TaxID=1883156 RepID=UPI000F3F9FFE|nr:TonB-dependent receptor [Winogradskyella sp.]RNC87815.1 MAG: TonB-dependent receptor [Winogradskyella sp.]
MKNLFRNLSKLDRQRLTIFIFLVSLCSVYGQEKEKDSTKTEQLDEVLVKAVRVNAISPITHSNLSKKELAKRNLGQDIATQLKFLPSVVTTSDAGAGIGYTGFRVRGTANQGINVTINGIPYNDAESATTFFVNLQDFTSSVENLQLQRGVGTSTNGQAAFGASLNILTNVDTDEASASTSHSIGSFNTRRHNVKFSTGLLNDHFIFSGRLSQITSDGYIDRASSDLKSYYLQGSYKDDNTLVKAIHFAGSEVTYQSWFGVDRDTAINNPTFNPAGAILDDQGNIVGFHDNQVDDYKQDHYQLHWAQRYNNNWSSNVSFNYTYGRGFFEEYENDDDLAFYGLLPVQIGGETITTSDIVRRRWLDNDFYVLSGNVNYKDNQFDVNSGLFFSTYEGDHFGEVIWSRFASDSELGDRYYFGVGQKNEFSAFAKADYRLNDKWQFYLDLQGRFVDYSTSGQSSDVVDFIVDEQYNFFNPKFGASFKLDSKNQFYASFARANREPSRNEFENNDITPRPERLDDIEFGWRYNSEKLKLNVNGYYMDYVDQLVLTGALDGSGAPIRANSGSSYRLGIEIDANVALSSKLNIQPNVALSANKNRDFFFQRDGVLTNLGNTDISFSPNVIIGNTIAYRPTENLYIALLSKYVGDQFMSNIESETSLLEAFFVNDFNATYNWKVNSFIDSVDISLLVNNIFNERYISNGYFFTFDDDFSNPGTITTIEGAGFYPQATTNFLLGATLNF